MPKNEFTIMPDDTRKFTDKVGAIAFPGGQITLGIQIIQGQQKPNPTKYIPYRASASLVGREQELTMLHPTFSTPLNLDTVHDSSLQDLAVSIGNYGFNDIGTEQSVKQQTS